MKILAKIMRWFYYKLSSQPLKNIMRLPLLISFLFIAMQLSAQQQSQVDSLLVEGVKARDNKEYAKSLELLTKARSIAEENQWYRQEFLAINNIGQTTIPCWTMGKRWTIIWKPIPLP